MKYLLIRAANELNTHGYITTSTRTDLDRAGITSAEVETFRATLENCNG